MKNEFDEEVQMRLLNHPNDMASRVDPLWRWIAVLSMFLNVVLTYLATAQ